MKAVAPLALLALTIGARADCSGNSDETTCNNDAACVWCKCAALPSACWSCADAQKLVPSVNKCDKGVVPGSSNGTCGQSVRSGSCSYDGEKAIKWLESQGCTDGAIPTCPGNRSASEGCTGAEYYARALAAAGAVPGLDSGDKSSPGSPSSAFDAYNLTGKGVFNLRTYTGLQDYQRAYGFAMDAGADLTTLPRGSFVWINECPTGKPITGDCVNPAVAVSTGDFMFFNPLAGIRVNCDVPAKEFAPSFPLYLATSC
eukprot:Hpha_TRINITY_DN14869_c5_g6::TRINITY_DN14869_c5_g6_i1::g.169594::m.169594